MNSLSHRRAGNPHLRACGDPRIHCTPASPPSRSSPAPPVREAIVHHQGLDVLRRWAVMLPDELERLCHDGSGLGLVISATGCRADSTSTWRSMVALRRSPRPACTTRSTSSREIWPSPPLHSPGSHELPPPYHRRWGGRRGIAPEVRAGSAPGRLVRTQTGVPEYRFHGRGEGLDLRGSRSPLKDHHLEGCVQGLQRRIRRTMYLKCRRLHPSGTWESVRQPPGGSPG